MIYRSNLTCPDLTPHFKHLISRPMGHSFGHDVPSDWGDKADDDPLFGIYKRCGFWTHDEAAILHHVVSQRPGVWLDIGAHTGWTTSHIAGAGAQPYAIEPMLALTAWRDRFEDNISDPRWLGCNSFAGTSADYFRERQNAGVFCTGAIVDGDHEPGQPLLDVQNVVKHLSPDGIILLHDFIGGPVRDAARWLQFEGFYVRIYYTPHVVACCWREGFTPPDHQPDPKVLEQLLDGRMKEFAV